jgi:hypothetical protein
MSSAKKANWMLLKILQISESDGYGQTPGSRGGKALLFRSFLYDSIKTSTRVSWITGDLSGYPYNQLNYIML